MRSRRGLAILIGILVAGGVVWRWRTHARGQLPARWVAADAQEVAPFWTCLFTKEVAVADLNNGQQARRLVEAAFSSQKDTFTRQVVAVCLPRLAQARRAVDALGPAPAMARYRESLGALQTAVELYARRLAGRQATKDLDDAVIEAARAWYADAQAGPRSAAYERFLTCAVPGLQDLAGDQALYRHLADRCFAADPAPFMQRVRAECAPLLRERGGAVPDDSATRRRFRGAEGLQVQSWESCSDIARAQQRMADAAELVAATDAYLAARPLSSPSR